MTRVDDYLTYIDRDEDQVFLKKPLFNVNIRLFKYNYEYRKVIRACISYLKDVALIAFDDYPQPFGISGANLAIPFNIIGVVIERGTSKARTEVMINPRIIEVSDDVAETLSNCGSLRLTRPIYIKRHQTIIVEYYDEDGNPRMQSFHKDNGGYTIQHEVDHNNGILITDRYEKKKREDVSC